jgi:hypothetical protein
LRAKVIQSNRQTCCALPGASPSSAPGAPGARLQEFEPPSRQLGRMLCVHKVASPPTASEMSSRHLDFFCSSVGAQRDTRKMKEDWEVSVSSSVELPFHCIAAPITLRETGSYAYIGATFVRVVWDGSDLAGGTRHTTSNKGIFTNTLSASAVIGAYPILYPSFDKPSVATLRDSRASAPARSCFTATAKETTPFGGRDVRWGIPSRLQIARAYWQGVS